MSNIIVTCKRKHTDSVQIHYEGERVTLTYWQVKKCAFHGLHSEVLYFKEYPELEKLYDGVVWDMHGVMALLDECCFSESTVAQWVDEEIELHAESSIREEVAHQAYEQWCRGKEITPLSLNGFRREMKARGVTAHSGLRGNVYYGIRVKVVQP